MRATSRAARRLKGGPPHSACVQVPVSRPPAEGEAVGGPWKRVEVAEPPRPARSTRPASPQGQAGGYSSQGVGPLLSALLGAQKSEF